MPNIVVIGAGVAGLTSALLLSRDPANTVTVVARHMPGDYDIEYTSPWAGANVLPMSDAPGSRWERATWPEMQRLAREVPEAGINFAQALLLRKGAAKPAAADGKPVLSEALFDADPWFRTLFDDYRDLPPEEVPAGYASASTFTSVCINTALYLPWLVGQCRARGVVFRRAVLAHVADAAAFGGLRVQADGTTGVPPAAASASRGPTIVVNCSGLLACRLGGVMDAAVQPARGQIVVVRDELVPMLVTDSVDDSVDPATGADRGELAYNMLRPGGGGTIVGGTYQVGRWDAAPDPAIAQRLLARIAAMHPQLRAAGKSAADLDVVRHGVGLRPYRAGGVRLEAERVPLPGGGNNNNNNNSAAAAAAAVWVVHNYGHAGWGYQGSYGCAQRVVELVEDVVRTTKLASKL